MDHSTFETLVRRLELDAHASPAAFRRKVLAIGIGAYVILFGTLAALVALFATAMQWAYESQRIFTSIKVGLFGLFLLPLIFIVLRVMFMRLDRPTGRALTRVEAPKLFEIVDKLRSKLNGPPVHHVLVTDDYNAAICQHARFGIFGGYTNYLIVGLPYMLGGTPKELLATLAHEYGHLCGNHGKAAGWIYRQRRLFIGVYEHISDTADDNLVSAALVRALDKFFPYYSAYTFVLSRQQEYEADKTAIDMAGKQARADGLVRVHMLAPWIADEFWPKLYANADRAERPPFMPFASMRLAFKASHGDWSNKQALDAAWTVRSDVDDTHPCLRDRLDAIGAAPALPLPVDVCAADVLLASGVARQLTAELDQEWWGHNRQGWGDRYRHVMRSQARIGELSGKPLSELKVPELQELATLKLEFEGTAAAKPVLDAQLNRPGGPYPRAALLYGRVLLAEGNARGLDYLREAALNDANLQREAAERGYYYLMEKEGEYAAAQFWDSVSPQEEAA